MDEPKLVRQSGSLGITFGVLELVLANIQAGYMAASELHHLPSRPSHAASDVKDLHIILDADARPKKVFVADHSLRKALAEGKTTKVQGLAPGVLINVRSQVVILSS